MLINVKMPMIVGILTFMSRINFVLSRVEHEKSFITSGPGLCCLSRHFGQATSVKIFRTSTVHFCSLKRKFTAELRQSDEACLDVSVALVKMLLIAAMV